MRRFSERLRHSTDSIARARPALTLVDLDSFCRYRRGRFGGSRFRRFDIFHLAAVCAQALFLAAELVCVVPVVRFVPAEQSVHRVSVALDFPELVESEGHQVESGGHDGSVRLLGRVERRLRRKFWVSCREMREE